MCKISFLFRHGAKLMGLCEIEKFSGRDLSFLPDARPNNYEKVMLGCQKPKQNVRFAI